MSLTDKCDIEESLLELILNLKDSGSLGLKLLLTIKTILNFKPISNRLQELIQIELYDDRRPIKIFLIGHHHMLY
jgi:hypothetical protein